MFQHVNKAICEPLPIDRGAIGRVEYDLRSNSRVWLLRQLQKEVIPTVKWEW